MFISLLVGDSSDFSTGMEVLYSNLNQPAFPGKMTFLEFIMK